jgi:hypothetical protein
MLRVLVGLTLIVRCIVFLRTPDVSLPGFLSAAAAIVVAGCLMAGFMTPVVAIVTGSGVLLLALLRLSVPALYLFDTHEMIIYLIVLTMVIALLGPGALSIDARMFGRREIRIPPASKL